MKHLKRFLLLLIALFVGAGLGHVLLSEFEPLRLIAFLVLCLALGELFYQIDQRTQDQS